MLKKIAAAALFAAMSSAAFAADGTGAYIGADLGATKIDGFGSNKTSFGVFGGYNFNNNFAVEAGYRQLGKYSFGPVDINATQAAISVIGSAAINNEFSVFGRLGYNSLDAKVAGYNVSASTNGALVGIGASYKFTPQVSGRIEFQRPASDTKNFSVGIAYSF